VTETGVPAVVLSGNLGQPTSRWSMNEAALALTRSLGRRGVPVYRFHPDRTLVDLTSRYCTHVPCPNLYDDPAGLVEALADFAKQRGTRPVLFPASDGAAQFIADNTRALKEHFRLTSPNAARIGRTQHKRTLIETARSLGVPVPQTYFPASASELPEIAGRVSYPVIVKPVYSPDWKRSEFISAFGRTKALEISGPAELIDSCGRLIAFGGPFMIQEIVPGPDENLVTFLGYVGEDGAVLAGCTRKKLRQYPPGFGYCSLTESVDDPEVMDLAMELLRALDYSGIGCVEFKRDARDGTPKLIEINTRAVRTSMLAIAAGVDFPWIAYRDCVSPGTVSPVLLAKVPVRWVHLRDEVWAALSLIRRRELSVLQWLGGFVGKPIVVAEFSWDDMRPGLLCWASIPHRLVSKLFRRLPRSEPLPAAVAAERGGN
jgi:predicted ATP-grasp superfamily ATP-dependent carboligase